MTAHPGPFLIVREDYHAGRLAGHTRVHIDPWPGPERTAAELRATWRKRAEAGWADWRTRADGALTRPSSERTTTYAFHDTDPRDQGVLW